MKLRRFLLVILVFCLACPLTVYAKTYTMSNTDISISVDDSSWYVFTRDNIKNKSELKELGITSDYMQGFFEDNMAYMDALLMYEDGNFLELLIRKNKLENSVVNLSNYSDEDVLYFAEEIASQKNIEKYSVYQTKYKFVEFEFFDTNVDYYISEFLTIVNKDMYTITFQSTNSITKKEHEEIKRIIDSISFDVDTSLKEPMELTNTSTTPSVLDEAVETFFVSIISGGLLAIFAMLVNKRKRAKKAKKQDDTLNNSSESKEPPRPELNNKVVSENLECQPKVVHKNEAPQAQEQTSQKDVAIDKGFDDIKKYKELLDLGIITQEEFDTKKKELLGL